MSNKEEITERLEHVKKMLGVLRRRLHDREFQEAQFSINVPPEIAADIFNLNERIVHYEAERAKLQTAAAEDQLPLPEAEYREILARVWSSPSGYPSVSDRVGLELRRLQLGILPERAQELEQEIRTQLAEEIFFGMRPDVITDGHWQTYTKALETMGRAIRLSPSTALKLLLFYTPSDLRLDVKHIAEQLLQVNGVWPGREDFAQFEIFSAELTQAFAERNPTRDPSSPFL